MQCYRFQPAGLQRVASWSQRSQASDGPECECNFIIPFGGECNLYGMAIHRNLTRSMLRAVMLPRLPVVHDLGGDRHVTRASSPTTKNEVV